MTDGLHRSLALVVLFAVLRCGFGCFPRPWDTGHESAPSRTKREKPLVKLNPEVKQYLLDAHNYFRSTVQPPAANMKLLQWDDELAESAQEFAEECIFEHHKLDLKLGQNLYTGPDTTGRQAMMMWWEEKDVYDIRKHNCFGDQCGHYTQLVWWFAERLGCGLEDCPNIRNHLLVCHYSPQGNLAFTPPYTIGPRCSQCQSVSRSVLCHQGLCVTREQCKQLNLNCTCPLECQNCGKLNPVTCRCSCKRGWDTRDCSQFCEDQHELCGQTPGFPKLTSCSLENYQVRDTYCRKMCKQCRPITEENTNSEDHCCEAQTCKRGYVLDAKTCECKLFCPGPNCCNNTGVETYCSSFSINDEEEEETGFNETEYDEYDEDATPVKIVQETDTTESDSSSTVSAIKPTSTTVATSTVKKSKPKPPKEKEIEVRTDKNNSIKLGQNYLPFISVFLGFWMIKT